MKNTFINLPIRNVADTDAFFAALGMEKEPKFCGEGATNAAINDTTRVMLLEDKIMEYFTGGKPDTMNNNLTLAIQFDTKEEVDSFFEKAIAAGATDTTRENAAPEFTYGKAFRDINGHIWEMFLFLQEVK